MKTLRRHRARRSRRRNRLKIETDWRFQLFFDFLRISPSYDLALRILAGEAESPIGLASDFHKVLKTATAFGQVREVDFRDWWFERAQHQFRASHVPKVRPLFYVEAGASSLGRYDTNDVLYKYLNSDRADEGLPACLVIAIPLVGKRSRILQKVNRHLATVQDRISPRSSLRPFSFIQGHLEQ